MTFKNIKTAEQIEAEKLHAERVKRVAELKRKLQETDYVALADYDRDRPEVIAQRADWRAEIREIEDWLEQNEEEE